MGPFQLSLPPLAQTPSYATGHKLVSLKRDAEWDTFG